MKGPAAAYWYLQARFGKYARLARRFMRRHGLVVSGGPFAGLRYTRRTAVGRIMAKLIGSYEQELHQSVQEIIGESPRTLVNIGSAEGYYTVGFARAVPGLRVHAYEAEPSRQALCDELARTNGVADRVTHHGYCTAEALARLPEPADVVICDVEGLEVDILRPDRTPWLAGARLLVELHDQFVPGVTPTLTQRFSPTHDIRLIAESPRDPAAWPALNGVAPNEAREALDEHRRDRSGAPMRMQWAVMTPRRTPP